MTIIDESIGYAALRNDRKTTQRYLVYAMLAIAVCFLIACSHQHLPKPAPERSAGFTAALNYYLEHTDSGQNGSPLRAFLDEFAMDELDGLIDRWGSKRILSVLKWFDPEAMDELIQTHGDDFVIVALHATIGAHDRLAVFDAYFGIDPDLFSESLRHSQGRFTGAMIIFETIGTGGFTEIARVFADALPSAAFMDSFYKDPYLLASAVRIISKRDPRGIALKEFLDYFPSSRPRKALFSDDLPGLVVAFSTIQEIKAGNKVLWVKEFLDLSDEQLAILIQHKPVDLSYVLYGGYRIGINDFKQVLKSIGKQPFRKALTEHTAWLADFLIGLDKVSDLSSKADFVKINAATDHISRRHPFLLQYQNYTSPQWDQLLRLFENLPAGQLFFKRDDKSIQMRVYLLGLLAIYQRILHEQMPHAMLTPDQFYLLKWQILWSTRYSENLNNMTSNFEVGRFMLEHQHMETIVLFLAHELAHQIYSICGFDAPLLSAITIHECAADIAARGIAQRLGFHKGMTEYGRTIIQQDDYSEDTSTGERELIASGVPHIIGRTQLGYIVQGFRNKAMAVDWEVLFPVSLAVLRNQTKMKHLSFVRDLVTGYTYCAEKGRVTAAALRRFIGSFENSWGSADSDAQMADVDAIEEMIRIAHTLLLRPKAPNLIQSDYDPSRLPADIPPAR